MIKVEVTGFTNIAQAKAFAEWYSNSGEQDIPCWLENDISAKCNYLNTESIEIDDQLNTVKLVVRSE